ncbi:LOW QUALITY PROTEIN: WD repeat, SAM and U-box domain-containing protein 1-like [Babylonia areolata]|uniref:LOW QUALITY PROTEIN: WD repeat, SAM and U-box domain-containing protein 1-like n=1 Tax=Babylonia areolata TaxID=304850 RepID=UPI003FCEFDA7
MADMVASQIHVISTHKGDVTAVAFGSTTLASVSGDKTIRLWDTKDFTEFPKSPFLAHSYIIHHCTFSPLGSVLATCSTDGKLILWDVWSGEIKAQFEHPSKCGIRVCKFSPDSSRIASGSDDDTICVWDIATRQLIRSFTGLEDSVVALAYSPDGHFLVSGSPNGDLHVWDAEFGHGRYLSLKVDAHDLGVTCCEFSPTFGSACKADSVVAQLLLATGGKDHLIKLWTFAAQLGSADVLLKCHAELPGHSDIVMSCAFSPSGEILASGSFDKSLRLWDPLKGVALFSIEACHNRFVTCCAFSMDGSMLATGSMDRTVKIWKLTDTSRIMYGLSGYEEPEAQEEEGRSGGCGSPMEGFSAEDVAQWLSNLGLVQYQEAFRTNAIDGKELLALTVSDLETHLGVGAFGHRNKILRSRDQGGLVPSQNTADTSASDRDTQLAPTAGEGERVHWQFSRLPSVQGSGPSHTGAKPAATLKTAPPSKMNSRPSPQWTVEDVVQWLGVLGLSKYQDSFRQNAIDGVELLALNDSDLSATLGVAALGHRNKILRSRDEQEKRNTNQKTETSSNDSRDTVSNHDEFMCPISMAIMKDPVIAADGYTYDRSAIQSWLEKGKDRSPMTNARLPHRSLIPNRTLKMLIQRHLEQGAN